MIYRIPPDNWKDPTQNNQTVFFWLVESVKDGTSSTDKLCQEAAKRLTNSVCARIVISKTPEIHSLIENPTECMVGLFQRDSILWIQFKPPAMTIYEKMKEARDIRTFFNPPQRMRMAEKVCTKPKQQLAFSESYSTDKPSFDALLTSKTAKGI